MRDKVQLKDDWIDDDGYIDLDALEGINRDVLPTFEKEDFNITVDGEKVKVTKSTYISSSGTYIVQYIKKKES